MSNYVKKYKYSEIFFSMQGEGLYTGVPTAWLRFWGCNLTCQGFSQDDPTNPDTWEKQWQTIDVASIKKMEDLPIITKGCDSIYSWNSHFSKLAPSATAVELCDMIENSMKSLSNPEGKFIHPVSKQHIHMAFTGGEPMMNQNAIVDVMLEFQHRGNVPKYVTVETNGTQVIRDKFSTYLSGEIDGTYEEMMKSFFMRQLRWLKAENFCGLNQEEEDLAGVEWFWSVSPKLFLSGEQKVNTLIPDVVASYAKLSDRGQLKYVCDGSDRAWKEVEEFTKAYRDLGVNWDVWIMPVGSSGDQQFEIAARVAEGALARGYNVAARVHSWIWNNQMGK